MIYFSMGGHGALISALKNPGLYKSVSAFSPISNPINCPWGAKAFSGYLGPRETGAWEQWDATELVKKYNGPPLELFVDQVRSKECIHTYIHVVICCTRSNFTFTNLRIEDKVPIISNKNTKFH